MPGLFFRRFRKTALLAAATTAALSLCLAVLPGFTGFLAALALSLIVAALVSLRRDRESRRGPGILEAELIGNLSHEMRTPLNGILGLTQVLLDSRTQPQQRELLEMVKASGESLLGLINDLLDYSKIQAGKIRMEPREFRLRRWLRQSVAMHAPQAHRKGLEIAYWVEPDVPDLVVGDFQRLRQVLSNLIVNAIKFTHRGEILVEVSSLGSFRGAPRLSFTVSDTGLGIPERSRGRIFEAFTQGENATPDHGGLGLGLAICSEIVNRMGGSISVESEPSKGSRFRFDVQLESEVIEEALEPFPSFAGMRALVVDDSPWQRSVLARELEGLSIEALTASSPEGALEAVERTLSSGDGLSLLLLDSRMPGADSLELAKEIRCRREVPTVLLTTSHERVSLEILRAHGIMGNLTKPVAPTHLVRAIEILRRGESVEKPEDVETQGMDRPILSGLRILLAEDHPINRTVVVRILGSLGAGVIAVANGREALELWRRERFDALILDVEMPEVDGLTAAREIREREKSTKAHLPIVALTAHARDEHREQCLAAGMDGFVTKPFEESELLSALRAALKLGAPSPTFDREAALRRANGDPVLLAELTALFLEETPETMRAIERALGEEDLKSVERLAHRLKGALLTLSASSAAEALELENAASGGELEKARASLARLRNEVLRLEEELQRPRSELVT